MKCKHCGMEITWNPVAQSGIHIEGSYRGKSRCGEESGLPYGYNAEPEGEPCSFVCLGSVPQPSDPSSGDT